MEADRVASPGGIAIRDGGAHHRGEWMGCGIPSLRFLSGGPVEGLMK